MLLKNSFLSFRVIASYVFFLSNCGAERCHGSPGGHAAYIGPYPHAFLSAEHGASIFRGVMRAASRASSELNKNDESDREMAWPDYVKALKLAARRSPPPRTAPSCALAVVASG